MWTSLKKILPSKIRSWGMERAVKFYEIQQGWDDVLRGLLGPIWTKKSKPVKLTNEILFVDCLNSIWANELQIKEERILKAVREKFKKSEIERIRFIG